MSGYIKYFDDGGKNVSFKIEDDDIFFKYNVLWNKIKKILNLKFYGQPIYDEKSIKTKIKTFNDAINTGFPDNEIPKERNHYFCLAAICIYSV